ncbi:MAG: chemotaxis protein methyltransferase CheR [Pseudonocardiales bacterium]|jgi:chemotaxis protein methyltransferase CheR|nr:chemotaxis protein methyltransferase CheR [Pseudonocardiales bacterium]
MIPDPRLEAAVDQISDLLNSQIGLRPEAALRGRLRRCVREEAAVAEEDLESYVRGLAADPGALQRLLNRVTVQETGFFRHPEHFQVLAAEVLPQVSTPTLIWSAGCANGQEAYSIAMVLEELGIAGSVIATDLSTSALQRTAAAQYTARELGGLSPARLERHLTRTGNTWLVNDAVRNRVVTLHHNLIEPLPESVRSSQVVFCRNVLIYLSAEHIRAYLDGLANALVPRSYLFLGAAEALWPLSDRFDTVRVGDAFIYRPRPEPARPRQPHRVEDDAPVTRRLRRSPSAPPLRTRAATTQHATQVGARSRPAALRSPEPRPVAVTESVQQLAQAGQWALDADQADPAVVAFRKWAYLTPDDAMAHLHLGLALEAAGDQPSARRAFSAARRAALNPERDADVIDGYAPSELLRLLEAKDRGAAL